jgi:HEAT repeat protein
MQLLATLQKPLPSSVAAPLRTEAWSDLQLWTQLGAWAEQRHTWALQIKMTVSVRGIIEPPKGIVAPYPDFFSGLAKLARQTGEELAKAQSEEQFDVKSAASRLLDLLKVYDQFMHAQNKPEFEAVSAKLTQAFEFHNRYVELHRAEMTITGSLDPFEQVGKDLEAMAQHCAATGQATDAEIKTLQLLDEGRENAAQKLNDFAPVCDRLAALATKSLKGEALTENDTKWIRDYGVTLAGFHFYYGNSYEVPRDDFPMVTRVFSNPLSDAMLYAGLARPQALYVIVPNGNTLQLYRGAVLTYREFVRPNSELLDDESWREMVSKGKTPPAPPFTRSFFAETSVKELLALLLNEGGQADYDYGDIEETLWQIGSRSTATDLPDLIQILSRAPEKSSDGEWSGTSADIQRGIAEVISELPWQSQQDQIITLLASPNYNQASAAALILTRQPALLDPALLTSKFSDQNTHARRLYCAVLATLPQPTADVRQLFQHALHDPESAVRWQAILALAKNGTNDLECQSLLLGMLNDTNQFVGAAAAYSLGRLGATNSAPALLAELKSALSAPAVPVEELQRQSLEIIGDLRREQFQGAKILDPEDLELRLSIEPEVIANMQRRSVMRLAAGPFLHLPNGYYDLATALIDALGDLQYSPAVDELISLSGTDFNSVSRSDYHDAATQALGKLAPDRLADQLMVAITNKQTDSYLREEAMVTLCTVSATNRVRELIPLLDDTTPIEYGRPMPGPSWRVCDRAAETIAIMLGWERNAMPHFATLAQREELMNRARAWAKEQAK